MANYFQSAEAVVDDCVADYQSLTGIVVDPDDMGRDEVVKFWWIGSALSHFFSALQAAYNNLFPQTADVNGLNAELLARDLPTQIQPQPSIGTITISGGVGDDIPFGTQVSRNLTGDIFASTQDMQVGDGGTVVVPFQSVASGQAYNIANIDEPFTLTAPPDGITAACVSATPFADGRDLETPEAMAIRVADFDLNEQTGGNLTAYEEFAQAASGAVVSAVATSVPNGPDTVGVVITAGTTDIADAVNNGQDVVRIPSDELVAEVQAYVDSQNPTTDVVTVYAPTEDEFDVTFDYLLYDETLRSSANAQIQNIIAIFLYSAESGSVIEPTMVERLVDAQMGFLIQSRRCSNFGEGGPPYTIPFGVLLKPGTTTLGDYT